MSEMIRSIIDQPWRPFGLSIALVLTSVGQWIFRTLAIHEFRHAAYMTNMVRMLLYCYAALRMLRVLMTDSSFWSLGLYGS